MKKNLLVLFSIFILMPYLSSQDYYIDDFKEFTFEMPDGWETMTYPGLKYKIIYGDSVNAYNQNMIFISQEVAGSFEVLIKDYLEKIESLSQNFSILKSEKFENNSQLEAHKLIIEISQEEVKMKLFFYLFKHNTKLFVCSASFPAETEIDLEEIFDISMKTFQIIEKEEDTVS